MGLNTTGSKNPSRQEEGRRENATKGGQAGRKGGASGRSDAEPKKEKKKEPKPVKKEAAPARKGSRKRRMRQESGRQDAESPPRDADEGRGGRAGKGPMPREKMTNKSETQPGSLAEPAGSRSRGGKMSKRRGKGQGQKGG